MAVDGHGMPPKRAELLLERGEPEQLVGTANRLHVVVVDNRHEPFLLVGPGEGRGFPDAPFVALAVAHEHDNVRVDIAHCQTVGDAGAHAEAVPEAAG